MAISKVAESNGAINLHTHLGESSREIAASLLPYIGRKMTGEAPNEYGHYRRYLMILLGASPLTGRVEVDIISGGAVFNRELDAFDAFGQDSTYIHPASN